MKLSEQLKSFGRWCSNSWSGLKWLIVVLLGATGVFALFRTIFRREPSLAESAAELELAKRDEDKAHRLLENAAAEAAIEARADLYEATEEAYADTDNEVAGGSLVDTLRRYNSEG